MPYICGQCRTGFPGFSLACPECGGWNTLKPDLRMSGPGGARPVALPAVGSPLIPRIRTNVDQLDRMLGEGFVPGSSVLLTGPPGAGKSTLLLQVLKSMKTSSLYVSGEESVQQIKLRADRLGVNSRRIFLLFEMNVKKMARHIDELKSKVVVIDSIQTVYTDTSDTLPGSSTQIRKCTYILRRLAQQRDFVLILVGQVTKARTAAGPKLLEHAVDVVLSLDAEKEQSQQRNLSALKNRFGSTGPGAVLLMSGAGLLFAPDRGLAGYPGGPGGARSPIRAKRC